MEIKVTEKGQPCRKCGTPGVVEIEKHKAGWRPKEKQEYWFRPWLKCSNRKCNTVYFLDSEKRTKSDQEEPEGLIEEQNEIKKQRETF